MQIAVQDTGLGIKDEDKEKLFKLFGFVQDSANANTHGIGLGLVIIENLVSQFGGKVWFESEYGKGSTFYFRFKLEDEGF